MKDNESKAPSSVPTLTRSDAVTRASDRRYVRGLIRNNAPQSFVTINHDVLKRLYDDVAEVDALLRAQQEENVSKGECASCASGLPAMMLDDDGCRTDISKRPGTPSHAVGDAWWPCAKWQSTGKRPAEFATLRKRIVQLEALLRAREQALREIVDRLRVDVENLEEYETHNIMALQFELGQLLTGPEA